MLTRCPLVNPCGVEETKVATEAMGVPPEAPVVALAYVKCVVSITVMAEPPVLYPAGVAPAISACRPVPTECGAEVVTVTFVPSPARLVSAELVRLRLEAMVYVWVDSGAPSHKGRNAELSPPMRKGLLAVPALE